MGQKASLLGSLPKQGPDPSQEPAPCSLQEGVPAAEAIRGTSLMLELSSDLARRASTCLGATPCHPPALLPQRASCAPGQPSSPPGWGVHNSRLAVACPLPPMTDSRR